MLLIRLRQYYACQRECPQQDRAGLQCSSATGKVNVLGLPSVGVTAARSGFSAIAGALAGRAPAARRREGGARQGHGSALAAARLDMLDGAAAALEGERDPRCLLAGFETVAVLAQAFARAGGEARRRAPPPVSPGLLSRTLQ